MQQHQFSGWAQTWHDDIDITRRMRAIRQFGRVMAHPVKWQQAWKEAGGVSGVLHLLSSASVREVKAFCNAIRYSSRRGRKSSDREQAVEELVQALLPKHYPSTKLRTRDQRPLQKFYGRMLSGCSSDFVEAVLDAQDKSNPLFQELNASHLLLPHVTMLKRRLANYLIHDGPQISEFEISSCFEELIYRKPPVPGTQPNMSASMEFSLELLQARVTSSCTSQRWPSDISELRVLMSIYDRLKKKKRSADKTPLIKLGLQLIELKAKGNLSPESDWLWTAIFDQWKRHSHQHEDLLTQGIRLGLRGSKDALPVIATRWKNDPDQYEHLLVMCLRQGLGGSADQIPNGYSKTISGLIRNAINSEKRRRPADKSSNDHSMTFSDLKRTILTPEMRWRLLRLYCQHVLQKGIDIETSSNYKDLANQEWTLDLFAKLPRERAIMLLKNLYKVNPNYNFLQEPRGSSIFLMRGEPRPNFNVELLLVFYQNDDADAQQKALEEIDLLRQKAATAHDQPSRALFAKAALCYSIVTGSLDAYAKTALWMRRFVNEAATVQSLYSDSILQSPESLAVLSGMPLSPSEGIDLKVIRERLEMANGILKSFHEARLSSTGKSGHNDHWWRDLGSTYRVVYKERVSRFKKITRQSRELEMGLFNAIWEGIVDLVSIIGSEFLIEVHSSLCQLVQGLSGPSSITAAEALLDYSDSWRKRKDRNSDQDTIASEMRNLTYVVVSDLAQRDTPLLAQDVIRRAIFEDPQASEWHRRFLSIDYLRNLPAEATKNMLLSFAAAVEERLDEQSFVKVGEEEAPKHAPPQSLIKVTTVKYLAQLLNGTDLVGSECAIEILTVLFQSATHRDVRLATVNSLFSMLNAILDDNSDQWRANPLIDKLLSTLDKVVFIAGSLNERRPVRAKDWAEAAEMGKLIAVSDNSDVPPLFEAVLDVCIKGSFPNLEKIRGELFSRLVLPTLRHSQEQHSRWFSLFLAKYKPTLDADILARVPITREIWYTLLKDLGHLLPPATVDEYNQHVLQIMKMPTAIKELNESLQNDVALRNDASVRHWLYIFGELTPEDWRKEIDKLCGLIRSPVEKATPTAHLVNAVVSQASILLDEYEERAENWTYLVSLLAPSGMGYSRAKSVEDYTKETEAQWTHWRQSTLLLAQGLIALIEQKSAHRGDKLLPSTFPLRLWCLPYPDRCAVANDEDMALLAKALQQTISEYLGSNESDVLLWTTLVDDAYKTLTSVYHDVHDLLCLAEHIGNLDLGPASAVEQLIKVSLALPLLSKKSVGAYYRLRSKKDLRPEEKKVGEQMRRLYVVMERWDRRGGDARIRDVFMAWKIANPEFWETVCIWGVPEEKEVQEEFTAMEIC